MNIDLPVGAVYLLGFAGSLALTWYLTPLALAIARRRGLLDHPGGHKIQSEAVPYLGGAAIVVAFVASVGIGGALLPIGARRAELLMVLGVGLALALVGLVDDLRGLGPWVRVAAEVVAGLAVWRSGIGAVLTEVPLLDAAITVLWVVGVTNAFNLLDNMDGLSAGVAGVAAFSFFVLGATQGQFLVAMLAITLAGCACGFLRHNFHPAKVYMGDAGSLFLGLMVAVIGLKLRFPNVGRDVAWFIPVLVVGVAVFDTALVVVSRRLNHRAITQGGRDHVSHRLVFVGIPVHGAVAIIYTAAAGCGWLALVLTRTDRVGAILLMGFALAVSLGAGVALGRIPVYTPSQRRRVMLSEARAHEHEPVDAPGPEQPVATPPEIVRNQPDQQPGPVDPGRAASQRVASQGPRTPLRGG